MRTKVPTAKLTKHKKFLQRRIIHVILRFVLYIIAIEINPNKIKITSGLTKPSNTGDIFALVSNLLMSTCKGKF